MISIRWLDYLRATPAEVELILGMQEQTFGQQFEQEAVIDLELAAYSEALLAYVDGVPAATALIAKPGAPRYWFERVIALDDPCFPSDLRRDNLSEWDGLIVAPAQRKRGLGRLLLLVLAELARAHGIEYAVGLGAPMSRRICSHAGFFQLGRSFEMGVHTEELILARVDDMARLPASLLRSMKVELDPRLEQYLGLHRGASGGVRKKMDPDGRRVAPSWRPL